MTDTTPEAIERMADYYNRWAHDIREMNGASVDADHADLTAATLRAMSVENEQLRARAEKLADALREIKGPTAMAMDARERVEAYRDTARDALKEWEKPMKSLIGKTTQEPD